MVVMIIAPHALNTTSFTMGDVWSVCQWRSVLSTTVLRCIVLMMMTSLIVMSPTPQTVQTTFVLIGIVCMETSPAQQRNVVLEGLDVEDVCV